MLLSCPLQPRTFSHRYLAGVTIYEVFLIYLVTFLYCSNSWQKMFVFDKQLKFIKKCKGDTILVNWKYTKKEPR
jgi:hypothetical protein